MKRTLCIICAAALLIAAIFAVTASATADSYIIRFLDEGFDSVSEDFLNTGGILPEAERTDNSADINFIADTGSSDTVSGIELSGKHAKIESSSTLNGNKYLSFSVPYTVCKNNNSYLRLRLDPMANKNTPKDELALLGDYEFVCFDFDFMTETGVYMLNTSIAPVVRILTSSGTHSTVSTSTSASIKLDSEGYYVIGTGSEKFYIDSKPYSWNHLSAVIHVPGGDLPKTTIRYYLNGEPITGENLLFPAFPEASAFYGSDTDYIWIDCLGINLGTKTYLTEDMDLSIDNCRVTKYLSGYSGEIVPVFGEDYEMPLGQTLATVRGEHFDDLLKAYGAAAPGDTMVLYADASGLTVNKSLTVETRGYSFKYELGRGMSEPTVSDGVYTFDRADEPYTVTWHIGDDTFSAEYPEGYIPES